VASKQYNNITTCSDFTSEYNNKQLVSVDFISKIIYNLNTVNHRLLSLVGIVSFVSLYKMNVTELARKLRINTKEMLEILPQYGFDIGAKAIKIDKKVADQISRRWRFIRKEIDERYRLIFESYISRINAVYEQVNAVERETFLNNLERVVDSIEIGSFPLIIHGEITFDCRKAIAIRKEAGFLPTCKDCSIDCLRDKLRDYCAIIARF